MDKNQTALSKFADFANRNPYLTKVIVISVVSTVCQTIVSVAVAVSEAIASRKD